MQDAPNTLPRHRVSLPPPLLVLFKFRKEKYSIGCETCCHNCPALHCRGGLVAPNDIRSLVEGHGGWCILVMHASVTSIFNLPRAVLCDVRTPWLPCFFCTHSFSLHTGGINSQRARHSHSPHRMFAQSSEKGPSPECESEMGSESDMGPEGGTGLGHWVRSRSRGRLRV